MSAPIASGLEKPRLDCKPQEDCYHMKVVDETLN